ncbi:hypothetical protein [Sphingomonas sp.]|uniref:hypothetical protein n=1 Tax=Sphingomonas sp. TaxID=28214 RepID=UPI0035C7E3E2
MNIGKLLGKVAKAAKNNPEIALAVVGLAAPGLVRKVTPVIMAASPKQPKA